MVLKLIYSIFKGCSASWSGCTLVRVWNGGKPSSSPQFLLGLQTCVLSFNMKLTMYFRLLVSPVVVYAQRNMAHMTNNAPEMARLQVCNHWDKLCKE